MKVEFILSGRVQYLQADVEGRVPRCSADLLRCEGLQLQRLQPVGRVSDEGLKGSAGGQHREGGPQQLQEVGLLLA